MTPRRNLTRRRFHQASLGSLAGLSLLDGTRSAAQPAAVITPDSRRPQILHGFASGDVTAEEYDRIVRPEQMLGPK